MVFDHCDMNNRGHAVWARDTSILLERGLDLAAARASSNADLEDPKVRR